jgi:hypothetical protein
MARDWYMGKVRSPLLPGPRVEIDGQQFCLAFTADEAWHLSVPYGTRCIEASDRGDMDEQFVCLVGYIGTFLRPNYPDLETDLLAERAGLFELYDAVYALQEYLERSAHLAPPARNKPELLN